MVKDTTLYDELEVPPNSTTNDIRKAYRKLSLKWHPDKNPDNKDEATVKFQKISEAFAILNDDDKRSKYDQFGDDFLKNQSGGGGHGINPEDLFSSFFGDGFGSGFGGGMRRQQQENEDIFIEINTTLKQVYCEESVNINFPQKIYCKSCDGSGCTNKEKTTCEVCGGQGKQVKVIRMGPMIQQMVQDCIKCQGKGSYIPPDKVCQVCDGKGFSTKNKVISFPLKRGLDSGNKIKLEKKGHHFKNMKTDVIIIIKIEDDDKFIRKESNLHLTLQLELYQSLVGFNKTITHIDGSQLHLNYEGVTEHNSVKKIYGKGMDNLRTGTAGDLFIKFEVKYPDMDDYNEDELSTLKKILSKNCKEELKLEESTTNNTNLEKVVLNDILYENTTSDNDSYQNDNDGHEGQGVQCAQQ